MHCDAKSCPSANKLSKKNAAKRTYIYAKGRGTKVFHAKNTRSENCATSKSRVPRCRYTATSTFTQVPRVKRRNRMRGRDACTRIAHFIIPLDESALSVARTRRYSRAEWLHDKSSERESRDELTASRNKGAVIYDSAFSFIPKKDV